MTFRLDINEKTGLYLGTEIDEKWWKRYKKHKLLARGNGKYWGDDQGFYFLRHLTQEPILIPLKNITKFKIGKWHSGRWCFGYPILKIIWSKDKQKLSSGFLLSKNKDDIKKIIAELNDKIAICYKT